MKQDLYPQFQQYTRENKKGFAVLMDPDKMDEARAQQLIDIGKEVGVDFFFVGGSLVSDSYIHELVPLLRSRCNIPVILFPGSLHQVSPDAHAILLLSLISGRNPDLLIGKHVEAAPILKNAGLEILPTGYMLIDGGKPTTASYISNTLPIPHNKPSIAASTAMAGEMLGLGLIYLDCGSGAMRHVDPGMVAAVRGVVDLPVIVGGGIKTVESAQALWKAGADILVVGNAIENDPKGEFIFDLARARNALASSPKVS